MACAAHKLLRDPLQNRTSADCQSYPSFSEWWKGDVSRCSMIDEHQYSQINCIERLGLPNFAILGRQNGQERGRAFLLE